MRYVRGTGNPEARILFVGEAPGAQEEASGVPFCGAAGNLLSTAMHGAGIVRSETFITNVVRFRPPGNNLSPYFVRAIPKRGSAPGDFVEFRGKLVAKFVPEHVDDLEREIDAVRPNVIVALGNWAMYFLTGKSGILSWRGSLLETTIRGRRYKVIPTVHPAYVLRVYDSLFDLTRDLIRAREESASPDLDLLQYRFELRPTFQQVMDRLTWLRQRLRDDPEAFITCDIETRRRQIACIGLGWSPTEAICIPIMAVERPEGYWTEQEELDIVLALRELLEGHVQVSNQNYLYDAFYMAALWGFRSIPQFDTMIAQNVFLPGKEKSLAYLSSIYARKYQFWKDEGREWDPRQPEDKLWHYNALDCTYTYEVTLALQRQIREAGLEAQLQFQMNLFEPVLDMMLRGVRVDPREREAMAVGLSRSIKEREHELEVMFGHPVNPRSSKQLQSLFYTDFGVAPVYSRSTGKPTTGKDALARIATKEPLLAPAIQRIEEIRTLSIFRSTFVESEGPRDRLYTSFNIAGTSTFRFSSSANPFGWGTNLQNVPKWDEDDPHRSKMPDIRKLVVPDPGMALIDIDLSKADLHVVVWEAEDEELREMLRAGVNVYKASTGVLGLPYRSCKVFIHGTNYGASVRTIARETGLKEREAQQIQAAWFAKHPGIKRWHERVRTELNRTRSISNRFGFRRRFIGRLDDHAFKEALAWVPQSTVAHVVNTALLRIWSRFRRQVQLLLQVHDSLLSQAWDIDVVPDLLEMFKVEVPYETPLVIPADAKTSRRSWGEMESYH